MIRETSLKTYRAGVVLVAAGRGLRLGGAVPKQFLPVGGRALFAHSLRVFDALDAVTQIVIVLPEDGLPAECEPELEGLRHRVVRVVGGARRQDSTAAGLAALTVPCDVALVHDAARPFPDPRAIGELIARTMQCGGGLLATRAIDTIKQADGQGRVAQTLDRETIWLAQTPQALRADLIERAIAQLRDPACQVTDEAGLLEQWGTPVALVEGGAGNFKVTRNDDRLRAEAHLAWLARAADDPAGEEPR